MSDHAIHETVSLHFRSSYGKIYARLTSCYGSDKSAEVEDAIQQAFYQALKSWKPGRIPKNIDGWLYLVAQNALKKQLRRENIERGIADVAISVSDDRVELEDDRLQFLLLSCQVRHLRRVSWQAFMCFLLKNLFGLGISEVSRTMDLGNEAVYKHLQRVRKVLKNYSRDRIMPQLLQSAPLEDWEQVEEIIYALFNVGFDQHQTYRPYLIDEDICHQALSLAKQLWLKKQRSSTANLMSLFCFHLARIPARYANGNLIPFFEQDRTLWNQDLLQLGFCYLQKPGQIQRYYLEALIVCTHMSTDRYDAPHWKKIVALYDQLYEGFPSSVVQINRLYALAKWKGKQAALSSLPEINVHSDTHRFYYDLLAADILCEQDAQVARQKLQSALSRSTQPFRQEHIRRLLENIND